MNTYHCMIDLKSEAKALPFAHALRAWMDHLKDQGVIEDWRLMRRKLNMASDAHRDFILEIEVKRLDQLDQAFRYVSTASDSVERLHALVTTMIAKAEFGLYRPFPDEERVERVALL